MDVEMCRCEDVEMSRRGDVYMSRCGGGDGDVEM